MSFVDIVVVGSWAFMFKILFKNADTILKRNGVNIGELIRGQRGRLHHSKISQPDANMIQTMNRVTVRIPATIQFLNANEIVIDKEGSD